MDAMSINRTKRLSGENDNSKPVNRIAKRIFSYFLFCITYTFVVLVHVFIANFLWSRGNIAAASKNGANHHGCEKSLLWMGFQL